MKKIVIFGASSCGEQLVNFFFEYFPQIEIEYFLDNNKQKQSFLGYMVFTPDCVDLGKYPIIVASTYYKDIKEQLEARGLHEARDFYEATAIATLYQELDTSKKIIQEMSDYGVRYHFVHRDELRKYKKNDKLFVFGTGSSTNSFTEEQWNHISMHDSWGVNFWNVHCFTPTYYTTEFVYNDVEKFDMLMHNVNARTDYPLMYIKDIAASNPNYYPYLKNNFDSVPLTYDIRLHLFTEQSQEQMLLLIKLFDMEEFLANKGIHLGGVTSITTVIFHAMALGYKEIILCGVDLYNDIHFYEDSRTHIYDNNARYPKREQWQKREKHGVMSEEYALRADKYIYLIDKLFLKEKGIILYTASTQSALYPTLELYFK
ncbi:hypothetical protein J25TS5_35190 [Paenibacillus faecis]|uniref:hypothetical protein n=1 Tax=Paenibacillus faecis TaxID=862114 RepID=UPI001B0F6FE2|nr:hypothetical protein [Paenibacillus faecis]GIO86587.1 hypothetical protein J25TS5_35190 [Paenibacillus faecis]